MCKPDENYGLNFHRCTLFPSEREGFNVREMFASDCERQLFTFSDRLVRALTKQTHYENSMHPCEPRGIVAVICMCNAPDKSGL